MPTLHDISVAFRTARTNAPNHRPLLRDLRRGFREPEDLIADVVDALQYVGTTATAAITEEHWNQAISFILPALPSMPATGGGSVRNFRNDLRRLLTDAASPEWLRLRCEALKRQQLVDTNAQGVRVFDQQPTDPIVALADAAKAVIEAATNATLAEDLSTAAAVLDRFKELTPKP